MEEECICMMSNSKTDWMLVYYHLNILESPPDNVWIYENKQALMEDSLAFQGEIVGFNSLDSIDAIESIEEDLDCDCEE